jgi:hypothetical protein
MAGRKADAGVRSGRFKALAANQKIITAGPDAVYRVFNTGNRKFRVAVIETAASGTEVFRSRPIGKHSSIDFKVPAGKSVIIVPEGSGVAPAGVFDIVGPSNPIRSGRFSARNGMMDVSLNGSASLWRFLNTGENSFEVRASGVSTPWSVEPDCSIDLYLPGPEVRVTAATPYSGVYFLMDVETAARGGRFSTDAAELKVLDFSEVTPAVGTARMYRVTNGGDKEFAVKKNGTSVITDLAGNALNLMQNQSIDFQVAPADAVKIEPKTPGDSYTGAYELLTP